MDATVLKPIRVRSTGETFLPGQVVDLPEEKIREWGDRGLVRPLPPDPESEMGKPENPRKPDPQTPEPPLASPFPATEKGGIPNVRDVTKGEGLPRYSRGTRVKFLGRHSRDVLEGEIIALLPPAPDGTPWYQVRGRDRVLCVSQNHIMGEIV